MFQNVCKGSLKKQKNSITKYKYRISCRLYTYICIITMSDQNLLKFETNFYCQNHVNSLKIVRAAKNSHPDLVGHDTKEKFFFCQIYFSNFCYKCKQKFPPDFSMNICVT